MTPARRRKREGDDAPFDDNIDSGFEEMRAQMHRIIERMMSGRSTDSEPFVYGLSMRSGPDGRPVIQRFGNTRPFAPPDDDAERSEREAIGEREPLTDVIEDDKTVSITVEIPGVRREDIELSVAGRLLKIKVDSAARRYFKEVQLPAHVTPDSTKATYKNGVLDIALTKLGGGSAEKRIKVE